MIASVPDAKAQELATNLRFTAVTPCRVMDTRVGSGKTGAFGAPFFGGGTSRTVPMPSSGCGLPSNAKAYALNVTLVPVNGSSIDQITLWPSGSPRPFINTMVDPSGRVVANNAIIAAGTGGSIDIYSSGNTELVLDVNGYFVEGGTSVFYPVTSCRLVETRAADAPPDIGAAFGPPAIYAGQSRQFPVPSGRCGIPYGAQAYYLNITVVPPGPLGYITAFPSGTAQPYVSTLNSIDGRVLANGAIVPAGASGAINIYSGNATELIIDIAGYFAPDNGNGTGLSFNTVYPCRTFDSSLAANVTLPLTIRGTCGVASTAGAYAANFTVTPGHPLGFLSTWQSGMAWLGVSLLNTWDGWSVGNAAIVAGGSDGRINVYATDSTGLRVDVTGYFAGPGGTKTLQRTAGTQDVYTITDNIERESTLIMCRTSACLPPPNRNITYCSVDNAPGVTARWTGSDIYNSQGIKVAFRATANASTGFKQARCFIDNNGVSEGYELTGALNVYNATPVLTGISPASITEGQTTLVTFYGSGFGTTPPGLSFSPANVSYYLASGNTDTQFQAYVTAPAGAYDVSVTSNGNGNGFQQGGGTQRTSPTPRRLDALPAGFGISVSVNGSVVTEGQTIYLPVADPQLNIAAALAPPGAISSGQVVWFAYATYQHPGPYGPGQDERYVTRSAYYPNATGVSLQPSDTWSYTASTGGTVTVRARLTATGQQLSRSFIVRGTNPPASSLLAELGGQWFWPVILTGEQGPPTGPSGWPQFTVTGDPVLGPPHGFGALQVELNPGATSGAAQLAVMFNWKQNTQQAKALALSYAAQANTFYWNHYYLWLDYFSTRNPTPLPASPFLESAGGPQQCLFANPWDDTPGAVSYVDGITIKKYNGADFQYLRWINQAGKGAGWVTAPTQLKFPGTSMVQCLRYVRRGCAWEFTSLPAVGGFCDAYHYNWVSGPVPFQY